MGELGEYWREHRDYQRSLPKLKECWKCERMISRLPPIGNRGRSTAAWMDTQASHKLEYAGHVHAGYPALDWQTRPSRYQARPVLPLYKDVWVVSNGRQSNVAV
jgi:hypothetical protein